MSDEEMINLVNEIPSGRLGRPEEVADLAYHLAYKGNYLTGQVISMDGGWQV
jgi:3-oxoacyl-[acyl-carrier protein] reductase